MSKEELASEICDHYCKYPEIFDCIGKSLNKIDELANEDAHEWLLAVKCRVCPLMKLFEEEVKPE